MVKLREVLKQSTNTEKIEPNKSYRLLGVRLEGKGPFIREEKLGSQIRARRLQRVDAGDFIYSRLFAWRGAFGSIPEDMNGAYVSSEFPNFKIDQNKVFLKFLDFFFRQRWVWKEIEKYCIGTTKASRNRFKEKFFLSFEVPLPSLNDQKRIVSRIESLIVGIERARRLMAEVMEEAEVLIRVTYEKVIAGLNLSQHRPLNKITTELGQQVQAGEIAYLNKPYLSLENIEAHSGRILEFRTCGEAQIRGTAVLFGTSDVLYSKLRPYLNKVATPSFEGCGTTELVVLRPDATIIDRNFLAAFLRSPQVVRYADASSIGTKMPRTRMSSFRELMVPLPPIPEQHRIVADLDFLQKNFDELKRLRTEAEEEIEELIPSLLDKAFKAEL